MDRPYLGTVATGAIPTSFTHRDSPRNVHSFRRSQARPVGSREERAGVDQYRRRRASRRQSGSRLAIPCAKQRHQRDCNQSATGRRPEPFAEPVAERASRRHSLQARQATTEGRQGPLQRRRPGHAFKERAVRQSAEAFGLQPFEFARLKDEGLRLGHRRWGIRFPLGLDRCWFYRNGHALAIPEA